MMNRYSIKTTVLFLGLCAIMLSSCAGNRDFCLFGYSTRPQHSENIRTVHVPIFKNRTYVRDIEYQLTEEVIKQIEAKTAWKVVNDPNAADAELIGVVVSMPKRMISQHQLSEVREAQITLGVEVVWRNCRTGQDLTAPNDADPLMSPLAPDLLTPIAPTKAVLVQRSAPFIPELGESISTAKQKAVNDLAVQIVSMLETPW